MTPLRQSFPSSEKRRAHVVAEVVYRVLDFLMPAKDTSLTFEKLTGKRR